MCTPLYNALQGEVTEAVCQASLSELHVLLAGRTREQHRGMGSVLPPPPWVCPAHWDKDTGVEKIEEKDPDRNRQEKDESYMRAKRSYFMKILWETNFDEMVKCLSPHTYNDK